MGGCIRSLYNGMIKIPKNKGEKILSTPEAEESLRAVRNSAIDAGINMVVNKVGGRKADKGYKKNNNQAIQEMEEISKAVKRTTARRPGGSKTKKVARDVFDDDTLEAEEMQ